MATPVSSRILSPRRPAGVSRSSTILPVAVALVIVTSMLLAGAAIVSRCVALVSGLIGG